MVQSQAMKYLVVIRKGDEGTFSVSCPALPGCHSQGDTREEALENIAIGIREYLEVVAEMNRGEIPRGEEVHEVEVATVAA